MKFERDTYYGRVREYDAKLLLMQELVAQLADLNEHFRKVDNAVFNGK